jgi:hypothetical protein
LTGVNFSKIPHRAYPQAPGRWPAGYVGRAAAFLAFLAIFWLMAAKPA